MTEAVWDRCRVRASALLVRVWLIPILLFGLAPESGATVLEIMNSLGAGAGVPLDGAKALAVDSENNVFVAGVFTDNVLKVTPGGSIEEVLDATGAGPSNPLSGDGHAVVDSQGNLYFSDSTAQTVFRVTPAGVVSVVLDETGDGGAAVADRPSGIAVDNTDNLYVAAFGSDNVFKISPAGVVTEILDGSGDGLGNLLESPIGVAVDAFGNVFVAPGAAASFAKGFKLSPNGTVSVVLDETGDGAGMTLVGDATQSVAVDPLGNAYFTGTSTGRVFKVEPSGQVTTIIDRVRDGVNLMVARSVTTDFVGNVFVTGEASDNVFKITPAGGISEIIDSTGDGAGNGLDWPMRVKTGPTGDVYVSGLISDNVFKITPSGVITEIIDALGDGGSHPLDGAKALAVDAFDNVYVSGVSTDNVLKRTPGGTITQVIDATGAGNGAGFSGDGHTVTDSQGNYFFSDSTAQQVMRVTPAGVISVVLDVTGDGAGAIADRPAGVSVDAADNLYVADFGADRVFRVSFGNCGNGVLDPGEACDDGLAPNDCCAPDCSFEPLATSCDDGNFCTQGESCNGAGACTDTVVARDCGDGDSCTLDICFPSPGTCFNSQVLQCNSIDDVDFIAAAPTGTGSAHGGPTTPGGLEASFINTSGGTLEAELVTIPSVDLATLALSEPHLATVDFALPSNPPLLWDVEYSGSYTPPITLTFGYDDTAFALPAQEADLSVYHYVEPSPGCFDGLDCGWIALAVIAQDLIGNTLTVSSPSLSPLALGLVVDPAEVHSVWQLSGIADGGTISFEIGGEALQIATFSGQSAEQVISTIASAINMNAALAAAGVIASDTGDTLVTNAAIANVANGDSAIVSMLSNGPAGASTVPAMGSLAIILLVGSAMTLGMRGRRGNRRI